MENRKYLEAIFSDSKFENQLNYWHEVLGRELVPPRLPMKPSGRSNGRRIDIKESIPPGVMERLLKIAKNQDLTVFVMLTAAFEVFLSRFTRDQELLLATPPLLVEGNDGGDDETPIYNELVVLRDPVNTAASFKELLVNTRKQALEAYKNQEYPLELVFKKMGTSLENVRFVEHITLAMENLHQTESLPRKETHWQLLFRRREDHLNVELSIDPELYDQETAAVWLKRYCRLVAVCLDHMDMPIKDLPLLEEGELEQLLAGDDGGKLPEQTVIQLFEAQAQAKPDRVALYEDEGRRALTFGELDRRAGRLALILKEKGVTPGTIGAILLPAGFDFVAAVLAVWKAGGAYLSLDPTYPPNRVAELLADSGAMLLLSKSDFIKDIPYIPLQLLDNGAAVVERTAPREQETDLDSLQIPNRSLIHYERYRPYIAQAMVKNSMILQFSRGCAFHCAYCFKIWKDKYINRSADSIFQEMKLYYDMGVRRFGFVDDLPNINVKESSKLYKMIIDNNMKVQLHYPNGIRGDILTKDYIDLMVEAGTVTMDLALETSSPRLQKLIRKHLKVDRLRDNLEYIMEKYPHVILECQILHGFPGETEAEALDSLEFIKSLHWVHFPYMHVLKIYPNTDMATIAMEQGVSEEAILRSADLGYHELPETLPFDHQFTRRYQAEFVNQYFMLPERLKAVLPYQMKALTEDELVQKYNSYLPVDISCFDDLLSYAGLDRDDVPGEFLPENYGMVEDLDNQIRRHFSTTTPTPEPKTLRILLLDLSQYFSHECNMIYDVVEPPLGLLYLGTNLQNEFGGNVEVKIAKSRIDFDDFEALKDLVNDFSPQVIGVRTLSFYKDFFHKTISLIRQWGVEALMVAGGPYATSSTDTMLLDRNIDLAVLGEGELTFNHLVGEVIKQEGDIPSYDCLRQIPGLAFIDPNHPIRNREILLLDQTTEPMNREEQIVSAASLDDPAYVIYTSGSTGKPKGVLVDHQALSHQIGALTERFQLDETFRYILLAAVTFDVSVMHLTLPLTSGGSVLLVDDQIKKDALRLWPLLRTHGVHIVNIVPAFMKALLKNLDKGQYGFRWLLVGGEAFDVELLNGLRETFGAQKIVNIYGPTETCINATSHLCASEEKRPVIPIGTPLPGYRVLTVDRDGNLLPTHGIGELRIGGPSLARGYLNRPELTARQFVQDPFEPEKRLYRSGDLGFLDNNGEFYFQGRLDQQVKVRGFRIEPGEIEHRLRKHPLVREAVVAMRPNGGDPSLTAYVVPSGSLNVADLGDYLQNHVPAYMIPAHFMELEQIPLTPNGKLDTKALPEPVVRTDDDYAPPRDQLERDLVELWADVVGVDQSRIGIDTNFFELGGHSLKATILVSRLHRQQGVKLAVVDLFQHPTIRRLAQLVKESDGHAAETIQPAPIQDYYPVSSPQRQLYLAQQADLDSTAFHLPRILPLDGEPDRPRLQQAFRRLIQRHEALRTGFKVKDGETVQQIHPDAALDVEWYDALPAQEIISTFVRPFDLETAPLMRVGLIKTPQAQWWLAVDLHHIVTDGMSNDILARDFTTLYEGGELPPLTLHYKDYCVWRQQRRHTNGKDGDLDFWMSQFQSLPAPLKLPLDLPRPEQKSFAGKSITFQLEAPLAAALKELAASRQVTMFMLLLSIYYLLLARLSGQWDIVTGTPVSGRMHPALEHVIGMFVNTLPLRHRGEPGMRYLDLLAQTKNLALEAFDHQDFGFDQLVERVAGQRDWSRSPLFDAFFTFHSLQHRRDRARKEREAAIDNPVCDYDVVLNALDTPDGVEFTLIYCTDLFNHRTGERIAGFIPDICRQITADPSIRIQDIEAMEAGEKDRLLDIIQHDQENIHADFDL